MGSGSGTMMIGIPTGGLVGDLSEKAALRLAHGVEGVPDRSPDKIDKGPYFGAALQGVKEEWRFYWFGVDASVQEES